MDEEKDSSFKYFLIFLVVFCLALLPTYCIVKKCRQGKRRTHVISEDEQEHEGVAQDDPAGFLPNVTLTTVPDMDNDNIIGDATVESSLGKKDEGFVLGVEEEEEEEAI